MAAPAAASMSAASSTPFRSHDCTAGHQFCKFQGFEVCSRLLQMVCFCDSNWWPGTGCRSVPTAADGGDPLDFPLPFACPFDSLFVAQVLQQSTPSLC
jgi:hypothetical protein